MIRINLLPPEMRAAAQAEAVRIPWRRIVFSAAGLALLVSLALPLNNGLQARRLERLRVEWRSLQAQGDQLKQVQESLEGLQRQAEALQTVKALSARWAPRLALLSDSLMPQLWLTRLEYTEGKGLRVEGSALVESSGDGNGQVAQFLEHLKGQPGFRQWFGGVELESVQHRQIQNEEIVDFVLLLTPTG